jgi:hypothetical protein
MSTMSQFFGGGGGGVGLGDATAFPGQGIPSVTVGDKVYLRSGGFTAATNADASVANMPHMKVLSSTALGAQNVGSMQGSRSMASNNAGTLVSARGSASATGDYSTDFGATWQSVTIGNGVQKVIWHVAWTGTRFVAVGASDTDGFQTGLAAYTSTNGITWTNTFNSAAGSGGINWSVSRFASDGAGNLILIRAGTLSNVYRSNNNGDNWTLSNANFDSGGGSIPARVGSNWVCLGVYSGVGFSYGLINVTTGAVTTSSGPIPQSTAPAVASNNSNLLLASTSSGIFTTTDGTNWVSRLAIPNVSFVAWNGTQFILTGGSASANFFPPYLMTTATGASYIQKWVVSDAISGSGGTPSGAGFIIADSTGIYYFVNYVGSTPTAFVRRLIDSDAPATNVGSTVSFLTATGGSTVYWRIK